MKKTLLSAALAGALLLGSSTERAAAQYLVIDRSNLAQNLVSALHSVKSVLNQITQISHEVQSLAYQAQNLQQMPASVASTVLGQYTTQFGKLVSAMQSINGIAQNVATLSSQFNSTFPNASLAPGPLSNANVLAQLSSWLNQSRAVYQGAYTTQAQVMGSLKNDSATVQRLLQTSGSSQGALGAIQTGNQLTGQIAAQLMKMNQQMASMNQAQLNWISQQSQMLAQGQKVTQNGMTGYTTASTANVSLTFDRFH